MVGCIYIVIDVVVVGLEGRHLWLRQAQLAIDDAGPSGPVLHVHCPLSDSSSICFLSFRDL